MRAVRVSMVTVVCAAALPGAAGAGTMHATTSPPPPAAVAQYVEVIPTSSGDQALGSRPGAAPAQAPVSTLPAPVVRRIERQGGTDAPALKRIVSSPDYGAPTRIRVRESPTSSPPVLPTRDPGLLSAAFGGGGSGDDAGWVLGALVLISGIAVAARFRRRRPDS